MRNAIECMPPIESDSDSYRAASALSKERCRQLQAFCERHRWSPVQLLFRFVDLQMTVVGLPRTLLRIDWLERLNSEYLTDCIEDLTIRGGLSEGNIEDLPIAVL